METREEESFMSGVRLHSGEDLHHTSAGVAETVRRNTGKKIPVQDNPAGSVFQHTGRTDNHIQPAGKAVAGKIRYIQQLERFSGSSAISIQRALGSRRG